MTNEQYGSTGCEDFSSEPTQPRNCINWTDSFAYCESHGARLPTEAEWEYAARGPDELIYPWGNDFVSTNVVYANNAPGSTAPVGSQPGGVSWVGAYDLSGNVWEWVNDWYEAYSFKQKTNPSGPDSGEQRVLRGSSWSNYHQGNLYSAKRNKALPDYVMSTIGFRCARDYE